MTMATNRTTLPNRDRDLPTTLLVLQFIATLACTSDPLRHVLGDVGASKAIQLGFSAIRAQFTTGEDSLSLWSAICLASLSDQPLPDLSRIETKAAEDCGIGPNTLVRWFCGALLESHRTARGCQQTPLIMQISMGEVIEIACGACAQCKEQLPFNDGGRFLSKTLDYARCAFALC